MRVLQALFMSHSLISQCLKPSSESYTRLRIQGNMIHCSCYCNKLPFSFSRHLISICWKIVIAYSFYWNKTLHSYLLKKNHCSKYVNVWYLKWTEYPFRCGILMQGTTCMTMPSGPNKSYQHTLIVYVRVRFKFYVSLVLHI